MHKYYKRNEMMIGRKIANEFILVPVTKNTGDLACMYTLNSVGSRIWALLDGNGKTIEGIVSSLTHEYEVDAKQAEADAIEFLEQMEKIGAVVTRVEGK